MSEYECICDIATCEHCGSIYDVHTPPEQLHERWVECAAGAKPIHTFHIPERMTVQVAREVLRDLQEALREIDNRW